MTIVERSEQEIRDALRANGWSVGVCNDYRLKGEFHTFYLFTHPCGIWAKGEGKSDREALLNASFDAAARMARWERLTAALAAEDKDGRLGA